MVMLETKINHEIEATDSRFFVEPSKDAKSLYMNTVMFALINGDYINETSTLIAQYGTNNGEIVDLEKPHDSITTIVLDTSRSVDRVYGWELTRAQIHGERDVIKINSTPECVTASQYHFSSQGRLSGYINNINPEDSIDEIVSIVDSEIVNLKIEEYNKSVKSADEALTKMIVSGCKKYTDKLLLDKIDKLEKQKSKIGFSAISLQRLY